MDAASAKPRLTRVAATLLSQYRQTLRSILTRLALSRLSRGRLLQLCSLDRVDPLEVVSDRVLIDSYSTVSSRASSFERGHSAFCRLKPSPHS